MGFSFLRMLALQSFVNNKAADAAASAAAAAADAATLSAYSGSEVVATLGVTGDATVGGAISASYVDAGAGSSHDTLSIEGRASALGPLAVAQNAAKNSYRPLTLYSSTLTWGVGAASTVFSASGVAIAGTLDVTGNVLLGAGGTEAQSVRLWNGSGNSYFGVEGLAGGALATGADSYDVVIASAATQGVSIAPGGVVKATFGATGASITGALSATTRINLPSYTVATLPAAGVAGGQIYVSNEAGGAVPAFSDGTNWLRVTDRTIVS